MVDMFIQRGEKYKEGRYKKYEEDIRRINEKVMFIRQLHMSPKEFDELDLREKNLLKSYLIGESKGKPQPEGD